MLEKKVIDYRVQRPTYIPSEKENNFNLSNDPLLPYKAMGTFWGILILLGVGWAVILIFMHSPQPKPHQSPPNLMIEGTK